MARKTKYHDDFPLLAEDYARRGMTDVEIAKSLGISHETLYQYQKKYPEFSDALKRGKAPVDVEVESALLKRARGFEYEEVTVEYKPDNEDPDNKGADAKARPSTIRKTKKMVVPDTTAGIFWLKNRRPQQWRDRHDFKFSGGVDITVISAIPRPPKKGKGKGKKDGSK